MSPNKWQLDTLNFITLSTQIKVILLQMDSFNTIVFFSPQLIQIINYFTQKISMVLTYWDGHVW